MAWACESSAPHEVGVYSVGADVLGAGRRLYRERLEQLAGYIERDVWPGFAPFELDLSLPAWAMAEDEIDIDWSA